MKVIDMAIEQAREYLSKWGLQDQIIELDQSSATVSLAAQALHTEEARIAKTMSFKVKEQPVLVVMAGDEKVDNAKYRGFFHCKAKMLSMEEVEPMIGHPVGGVCPFGIHEGVTVYLDESLKRFETVFPACGSGNSAIELTPDKLFEVSAAVQWVDICK